MLVTFSRGAHLSQASFRWIIRSTVRAQAHMAGPPGMAF